ncbi:putative Hemopexin-like domain-containing protein [Rosa chinensis]|uniref:Putative Hemopexin-like domain-containing protein n=1 Tax=Rosa chinensis TaxID=74649 RepID=A0A2P6QLQ7_ROSCH|nr:putative Hemopexin-like domain-containing protein [Rosa chinensis]
MFPFLRNTVFESGIDAAFESTTKYEAYLFKDDKYALINYGSGTVRLIHVKPIRDGYPSLKNTIFASGIEAALASHRYNEAYLFKGDSYCWINFGPGTTNDFIGGVKQIRPNWPSLRSILPRKNHLLDVHNHTSPGPDDDDRDQDEL